MQIKSQLQDTHNFFPKDLFWKLQIPLVQSISCQIVKGLQGKLHHAQAFSAAQAEALSSVVENKLRHLDYYTQNTMWP